MGREIRRVPPNWEHPRHTKDTTVRCDLIGEYMPMMDQDYESAAAEWIAEFEQWNKGEHPTQQESYASSYKYYWEWAGTPDEETARPAFTVEPTWYQGYETVSEGTPFTPAFATKDELVDWLVENGDPVYGSITKKQAESFVEDAYAPSMVMTGGQLLGGIQAL